MLHIIAYYTYMCAPQWLSSKESTCNSGTTGDAGSIPGLGRFPGEWNGNPLQDSCRENPLDRGAWQATVHGAVKSRTRLTWLNSMHTYIYSHQVLGNPAWYTYRPPILTPAPFPALPLFLLFQLFPPPLLSVTAILVYLLLPKHETPT